MAQPSPQSRQEYTKAAGIPLRRCLNSYGGDQLRHFENCWIWRQFQPTQNCAGPAIRAKVRPEHVGTRPRDSIREHADATSYTLGSQLLLSESAAGTLNVHSQSAWGKWFRCLLWFPELSAPNLSALDVEHKGRGAQAQQQSAFLSIP